ncbi:LacI family DNA-binding transcriptional regulator [Thermoactinospora rubra]|uniref:LacI family DNA-binding transcriptional regulator n=1 Tax=Thermoactinospora rubra TaxID=1088767 RepID=UPI003B84ADA6
MAHRTIVYDVAKRAGVSIATVSHIFRQPERVRPETRELVLEAEPRLAGQHRPRRQRRRAGDLPGERGTRSA